MYNRFQFCACLWLLLVIAVTTGGVHAQRSRNKVQQYSALQVSLQNGMSGFTAKFGNLLYQNAGTSRNVLFSPANLYTGLGLLQLGTSGTTSQEILDVMGFPKSISKDVQSTDIHKELHNYIVTIEKSNISKVAIANGIFVQEGFSMHNTYQRDAASYYNSEIKNLKFQEEPAYSLDYVNEWVSNKTYGKLPHLFQEPFPLDTKILLGSCLYFNGKWKNGFPKKRTHQGIFKTQSGLEKTVTFMNNQAFVPYFNNEEKQYEGIIIAYENEFAMYIVLPYSNSSLPTLIDSLDQKDIFSLVNENGREQQNVNYTIPKLKFGWNKDVVGELSSLGIKTLFTNPDFKLQNKQRRSVRVSQVTHATDIEVEETGTIAVAATFFVEALSLGPSIPPHTIEFNVNRPFMFFIFHRPTKVILFSAAVNNP